SFIHFYHHKLGKSSLCYITGEEIPTTEKHADKIRHEGDRAKLISQNDAENFTYRGRFKNASEVASIGYDVSQKAHNALKWLIRKQGKEIGDCIFLIWGNTLEYVPDIYDDNPSLLYNKTVNKKKVPYTHGEF